MKTTRWNVNRPASARRFQTLKSCSRSNSSKASLPAAAAKVTLLEIPGMIVSNHLGYTYSISQQIYKIYTDTNMYNISILYYILMYMGELYWIVISPTWSLKHVFCRGFRTDIWGEGVRRCYNSPENLNSIIQMNIIKVLQIIICMYAFAKHLGTATSSPASRAA